MALDARRGDGRERPPWAPCAAIFAASLALWSAACAVSFRGLDIPDALDYAQIARESYRDGSARSLQSFPYVLGWLASQGHETEPPWPNVTRFPLPVALRFASFALVGASDLGAVLPSGVFLAATAVVIFLLGRRLGDPVVGWLGAGLYVAHPTTLFYALSGLTETVAGFFVSLVALGLTIAGDRERSVRRPAFALGALIGVAALERSNLLLAAPIAGALLAFGPERRGARSIGPLALGVLVGFSPWVVHDLAVFGKPLVQLTSDRGLLRPILNADPFYGYRQYPTWPLVFGHLDRFTSALSPTWMARHWSEIFGWGFGWVGPLLLLGAIGPKTKVERTTWIFAVAGVVATFLLLSGMYPTVMRFFFPWTPLCVMLAVAGPLGWVRRVPGLPARAIPIAGAALLAGTLTLTALQLARERPRPADPGGHAFARLIAERVAPGGVVASDRSDRVAWRSMRPSVRFFWDPARLGVLERDYFEVAAIALWHPRTIERFRRAFEGSPLEREFVEVTPVPGLHALWLRRTPREPRATVAP
jgi:4-amino-4-deoxy-L-arabinose transferase-like glycosyltransferase